MKQEYKIEEGEVYNSYELARIQRDIIVNESLNIHSLLNAISEENYKNAQRSELQTGTVHIAEEIKVTYGILLSSRNT